jgi:hypothetical protein
MLGNEKYEVGENNCVTLGTIFYYLFATSNNSIGLLMKIEPKTSAMNSLIVKRVTEMFRRQI